MKRIIFILLPFSLFLSCHTEKPNFDKYVEEHYIYRDTLLNYSIDSNLLVITFPNGTNFKEWWLDITINDTYLGSDYYKVSNNQIHVKSDKIAKNLDKDTAFSVYILSKPKYMMFFDKVSSLKFVYINPESGILKPSRDPNKLDLTRIDLRGFDELEGENWLAFKKYFENLFK